MITNFKILVQTKGSSLLPPARVRTGGGGNFGLPVSLRGSDGAGLGPIRVRVVAQNRFELRSVIATLD